MPGSATEAGRSAFGRGHGTRQADERTDDADGASRLVSAFRGPMCGQYGRVGEVLVEPGALAGDDTRHPCVPEILAPIGCRPGEHLVGQPIVEFGILDSAVVG